MNETAVMSPRRQWTRVAAEAGRTLARLLHGEPVERKQICLIRIQEERGSLRPDRIGHRLK